MVSVSCLLICAYFKKVSYYFFVFQALKVLESGELLVLFCVEVFGFLKIFILCTSLFLNLESREKRLLERLSPGKKPHRKNAYSTFCISVIPPIIN